MTGYDASDLLSFLQYSLDKGLGKKETIKTRIVSVGRIVDVVGPDEIGDVREIDTDHIMERFVNLEGTKFSPGSLASYKSRLNSSISDFLRYKENPAQYRPTRQRLVGQKTESTSSNGTALDARRDADLTRFTDKPSPTTEPEEVSAFPIPLRQGTTVKILGLPHDLTQNEAQRIANIVKALAVLEE